MDCDMGKCLPSTPPQHQTMVGQDASTLHRSRVMVWSGLRVVAMAVRMSPAQLAPFPLLVAMGYLTV